MGEAAARSLPGLSSGPSHRCSRRGDRALLSLRYCWCDGGGWGLGPGAPRHRHPPPQSPTRPSSGQPVPESPIQSGDLQSAPTSEDGGELRRDPDLPLGIPLDLYEQTGELFSPPLWWCRSGDDIPQISVDWGRSCRRRRRMGGRWSTWASRSGSK